MDDATRARIDLGRLRFLGAEATTLRKSLDRFLDHAYAFEISIDRDAFRAALELRAYLEAFSRDALF